MVARATIRSLEDADNDVIFAGEGNDRLDGGKGDNDVLVLSGNRVDYKFAEQLDGSLQFSERFEESMATII